MQECVVANGNQSTWSQGVLSLSKACAAQPLQNVQRHRRLNRRASKATWLQPLPQFDLVVTLQSNAHSLTRPRRIARLYCQLKQAEQPQTTAHSRAPHTKRNRVPPTTQSTHAPQGSSSDWSMLSSFCRRCCREQGAQRRDKCRTGRLGTQADGGLGEQQKPRASWGGPAPLDPSTAQHSTAPQGTALDEHEHDCRGPVLCSHKPGPSPPATVPQHPPASPTCPAAARGCAAAAAPPAIPAPAQLPPAETTEHPAGPLPVLQAGPHSGPAHSPPRSLAGCLQGQAAVRNEAMQVGAQWDAGAQQPVADGSKQAAACAARHVMAMASQRGVCTQQRSSSTTNTCMAFRIRTRLQQRS